MQFIQLEKKSFVSSPTAILFWCSEWLYIWNILISIWKQHLWNVKKLLNNLHSYRFEILITYQAFLSKLYACRLFWNYLQVRKTNIYEVYHNLAIPELFPAFIQYQQMNLFLLNAKERFLYALIVSIVVWWQSIKTSIWF